MACRYFGILLLGIFSLTFQAPGEAWAAKAGFDIRILSKTETGKNRVRLGMVSKIRCASPELKRKLEALDLGKSPKPGKIRTINRNYIALRLRQLGIESTRYVFKGSKKAVLKRRSILISKDRIEKITREYLLNKPEWKGLDVEIKDIRVFSEVAVPDKEISFSFVEEKKKHMRGVLPLLLHIRSGKAFQKRTRVLVKVRIYSEVVVANRPLRRHRRITEDDIWLRKVNIAGLSGNIVTDINEIIGKRTRGYIRANAVLRQDLFEMPPLIKRGDMVLIVAEKHGMKITAIGQVKKDGRLGERIGVVNLDSKKMIFARVVDAQTVRVDF